MWGFQPQCFQGLPPINALKHQLVHIRRRAAGDGQVQMLIGLPGDAPAPGGPGQEPDLQEVRLVHVLQGHGLLVDGGGQGLQAHGAAAVIVDDSPEHPAVDVVQAQMVHLQGGEGLVRQILKEELTAIADKYGDDRLTEIQDVEDEIDIEDLIEEEQCVFTLTEAGYIKRTPVSEYTAQSKGGMGKKGITTREEDTVVDVFTASTHDHILFFTDTGKVYRKKGYQIPESGKTAKGTNLINILQIEQGERVQAMLHYRETGEEQLYLMMVTRKLFRFIKIL